MTHNPHKLRQEKEKLLKLLVHLLPKNRYIETMFAMGIFESRVEAKNSYLTLKDLESNFIECEFEPID